MYQVQIQNWIDPTTGLPVSGWTTVSTHTLLVDANAQMQVYITNNGILSSNIQVTPLS